MSSHIHIWRAATAFFRGGWNAVQVQLVVGHHSPAFTLGAYVHLLPDDLPEPPYEQLAERAADPADRSGDEVREDPVANVARALP